MPLGSKSKGGEAQRRGRYFVLNAFCALWLLNHTRGLLRPLKSINETAPRAPAWSLVGPPGVDAEPWGPRTPAPTPTPTAARRHPAAEPPGPCPPLSSGTRRLDVHMHAHTPAGPISSTSELSVGLSHQ